MKVGSSVKLSTPLLLSSFYLDALRKDLEKKIIHCPVKRLPVFQEGLLDQKLNTTLLDEYERYEEMFRSLSLSGQTIFRPSNWRDWIHSYDLKNAKSSASLMEVRIWF
jgi:hypothetical protein